MAGISQSSPDSVSPSVDPSFAGLIDSLHLGVDPYDQFDGLAMGEGIEQDLKYRHTRLDRVFFEEQILDRLKCPKLIVEIGSFKGGSAIRMADSLTSRGLDCCILCIDTFLGDANMWLQHQSQPHFGMRFRGGRPLIYESFMVNVLRSGHQDRIVPLPVSSLVGIEILSRLTLKADAIFLDSAHQPGETYLEITHAADKILSENGILFGDDFNGCWPGVVADVSRFASERKKELIVKYNLWVIANDLGQGRGNTE